MAGQVTSEAASKAAAPRISLIVAMDRNRAIGKGNALPWRLPDDLRRFKAVTIGKPVLMGRRTAQSLGRPLPGRLNLVMTRGGWTPLEGMQVVPTLDDAIGVTAAQGAAELCVIGGGEIYALTLAQATDLRITHVDTEVEGADAFFPAYNPDDWEPVWRERHVADERHASGFEYVDYIRRVASPGPRA